MSSRITDLDRAISANLRKFREQAKLTQPAVAGHLGITYQSYQKMENGRHAFRVSTLDRLARLYDKPLHEFLGSGASAVAPTGTQVMLIFHGLTEAEQETALQVLRKLKHSGEI